jgi:hypothetical protein
VLSQEVVTTCAKFRKCANMAVIEKKPITEVFEIFYRIGFKNTKRRL